MKRLLFFFFLACLSVFGAIAGVVHYPEQSTAEVHKSNEEPVVLTFYTPPRPEPAKKRKSVPKEVKKTAPKPLPRPKTETKRADTLKPEPQKMARKTVPEPAESLPPKVQEAVPAEEEMPVSAVPTEEAVSPEVPQPSKSESQHIVEAYYGKLYSRISRQKYYPHQARRFGIEGEVTVVFFLDSEGKIIETKLLKKSGSRLLDRAALEIFRQIEQFEKPPETMVKRSFEITIDYHLS
ncbi:energy transducer TonB [Sulfurimonas sp. HSL3-7]|uniref:energy transducer TonB n=1 Tax=Sulfonitrofixus jiaomeiensis TaxID=3131938 RepID=UPI0031F88F6E